MNGGGSIVGRDGEIARLRKTLASGWPAVVVGPTGSGRSALATAALRSKNPLVGGALATVAHRPYVALERAFAGPAPDGDAAGVASWAVDACGGRPLIVDDLHFAHPATIAVLEHLAGRVPLVLTVAAGEPGAAAVLTALDGWGDLAPERLDLTPLGDDAARALVLSAAPGLSAEEVERVVAGAGGIPAWLLAGARLPAAGGDLRAAALVGRLDLAARTALAAAALAARPVERRVLGPGVQALEDAGLVSTDEDGLMTVVAVAGAAALARVTEADVKALHLALARHFDDGEAARHLAAAGDVAAAVAAAQRAASSADTAVERAGHLHFAATLDPNPTTAAAAAEALLRAGDVAAARSWAPELDHALAARLHRLAGATHDAADAVRAGLATAAPRSSEWRRLLIEAAWSAPPEGAALAASAAERACAGTPSEPHAAAAAAVAAFTSGAVDGLARMAALDTTALPEPDRFHVGLLRARALAQAGSEAAAAAADEVAAAARASGATAWADVAAVEACWFRYLHAGSRAALAAVAESLDAVLAGAARERARALVHLALVDADPAAAAVSGDGDASPSALRAAVAADAFLAVDDVDAAAVHAAIAGTPVGDPVVALLAGPAAIAAACRWGVPPPPANGFRFLSDEADALLAADAGALANAAQRWRDTAARGVVRCLLSVGTEQSRNEAAALATDAGLLRWAARAGAQPRREQQAAGVVTPRERQVLELIGAGCTTPMIARRLGITEATVESHVKAAKTKLGVTTRAAAVAAVE